MGNPSEGAPAMAGLSATGPDDIASALQAARGSAIASLLSDHAMLRVEGPDAQAFLQAQLTCNVFEVTPTTARLGGYCTPQGRLLANFLLVQIGDRYQLLMARDLSEMILARLQKFVLRSRVSLGLEQDLRAVGIGGPRAGDALATSLGSLPREPMQVVESQGCSVVRLPGSTFVVLAPSATMDATWQSIAGRAVPAPTCAWDWLQVQSGLPWITSATQEQFVPQMVGLDVLGGVSFEKGCYPGQEIVARTHYLGEVKRKLVTGHVHAQARPGDALLAATESRGVIVNAAPSPEGGMDLLAVVHATALEEKLRLRDTSGPEVHIAPPAA